MKTASLAALMAMMLLAACGNTRQDYAYPERDQPSASNQSAIGAPMLGRLF